MSASHPDQCVDAQHCRYGPLQRQRASQRQFDRAGQGRQHHRGPTGQRGSGPGPGSTSGQLLQQPPPQQATETGAEHRHVQHVGAEHGQAAVSEDQGLDRHHQRQRQHAERHAQQGAGQHAAKQVPRSAAANREIHHLRGEKEGADRRKAEGVRFFRRPIRRQRRAGQT